MKVRELKNGRTIGHWTTCILYMAPRIMSWRLHWLERWVIVNSDSLMVIVIDKCSKFSAVSSQRHVKRQRLKVLCLESLQSSRPFTSPLHSIPPCHTPTSTPAPFSFFFKLAALNLVSESRSLEFLSVCPSHGVHQPRYDRIVASAIIAISIFSLLYVPTPHSHRPSLPLLPSHLPSNSQWQLQLHSSFRFSFSQLKWK